MAKSKVKIRSAYDVDLNEDIETGLSCLEPTLTKQAEAEACDVNRIVERWLKSGGAIDLSERVGQFLDVSEVPDYHSCQNFIASAQAMFGLLPADVRERFENDPGKFLDFASDGKNAEELVSMGLATAKVSVDGAAPPASASATSTDSASLDAQPPKGAGGTAQ